MHVEASLDLVPYSRGGIYAPDGVLLVAHDDLQGSEWTPPKTWDPAYEVWELRPTRVGGERIAWLGKVGPTWAFRMVRGVAESARWGIAKTRSDALHQIWLRINGGAVVESACEEACL